MTDVVALKSNQEALGHAVDLRITYGRVDRPHSQVSGYLSHLGGKFRRCRCPRRIPRASPKDDVDATEASLHRR